MSPFAPTDDDLARIDRARKRPLIAPRPRADERGAMNTEQATNAARNALDALGSTIMGCPPHVAAQVRGLSSVVRATKALWDFDRTRGVDACRKAVEAYREALEAL